MRREWRSCAPGKLLLLGEYAIFLGARALGVTTSCTLEARLQLAVTSPSSSPQSKSRSKEDVLREQETIEEQERRASPFFSQKSLLFSLKEGSLGSSKPLLIQSVSSHQLDEDSLQPLHPALEDLLQFLATHLPLQTLLLLEGAHLHLLSTIPQSAGMGSSAALCVALTRLFGAFAKGELEKERERGLARGGEGLLQSDRNFWTEGYWSTLLRRCEDFFHGQSSGLDPLLCAHPGLSLIETTKKSDGSLDIALDIAFARESSHPKSTGKNASTHASHFSPANPSGKGAKTSIAVDSRSPSWFWLHSGPRESTTAQTVQTVLAQGGLDERFLSTYQRIFSSFLSSVINDDARGVIANMRASARLLSMLGIVPKRVEACIQAIEEGGGGCKVSGAGAIRGEGAGALIAYGERSLIDAIAKEWGYYCQEFMIPRSIRRLM